MSVIRERVISVLERYDETPDASRYGDNTLMYFFDAGDGLGNRPRLEEALDLLIQENVLEGRIKLLDQCMEMPHSVGEYMAMVELRRSMVGELEGVRKAQDDLSQGINE